MLDRRHVDLLARIRARFVVAVAIVASLYAAGCKADAELVELRLFPCTFDGQLPGAVRVELQGLDADGNAIGDLLQEDFEIPDDAFDDDYATVGYRPQGGVERAAITVAWYLEDAVSGPADAEIQYEEPIPAPGEVVSLTSEDCPDGGLGTDTGDGTGTSSDGGGTGDGDSSTATGTTSGTSGGGDTSGSTTGGSTGDTATSSAATTTDATTTPTWDDLEGTPCGGMDDFVCQRTGVHDWAGKLLECTGGTWSPSVDDCPTFCPADFPDAPEPGGCHSQWDAPWACLCTGDPQVPCTAADETCTGDSATLCVDGFIHKAYCPSGCLSGMAGVRCAF